MICARRIDATSIDPGSIPGIGLEYKTRLAGDAFWAIIHDVDVSWVRERSRAFFPLFIHHGEGIDVVTPHETIRWNHDRP